jgi:hypothetical protein
LAGPKNQAAELPDLDTLDFTTEELGTKFRLWGAEHGMINIFTASDGHDNNPHEVRKHSAAEYYTRAGFKKFNKEILNYKNDDPHFLEVERGIPTLKTANFVQYVDYVLLNLDVLLRFYDGRFTSLRFLNYIGRQRADAELANIFVNGGKKYLQ